MINNTLKEIRKGAGLTQRQLAELIGKDRSLISKFENGDNLPSVETAKAIGKVLNVSWSVFYENLRKEEK